MPHADTWTTTWKEASSDAPELDYSVPLPGAHTGRRIVHLDFRTAPDEWTEPPGSLPNYAVRIGLQESAGVYTYDAQRALQLWKETALAAGISEARITAALMPLITSSWLPGGAIPDDAVTTGVGGALIAYLRMLSHGRILLPSVDWSGTVTTREAPAHGAEPGLFLVEVWGVSSFPTDYGLGKTIKTLTLLPGESLSVTMRTWRATETTFKEGSSIVDSYTDTAAQRFGETMQAHTTDKATRATQEAWHAEAEVSASWGFGSAKVAGGASASDHASRERFAEQANQATLEHTRQACAARQIAITSSSEFTESTKEESVTERTITNVNMRRTLNFVFRELIQRYVTKVHLKEVRLAYTNGAPGSWREVPMSGAWALIRDVLRKDSDREQTFDAILDRLAVCFDHRDRPVRVLERVAIGHDQWFAQPLKPGANGHFKMPASDEVVRFARGPLGQDGERHAVEGVVVRQFEVVMRTDGVFVEAVLGRSDALDDYAMAAQRAETDRKMAEARRAQLENARLEAAIAIVNSIGDPAGKVDAYARLFPPPAVPDA